MHMFRRKCNLELTGCSTFELLSEKVFVENAFRFVLAFHLVLISGKTTQDLIDEA